MPVLRTTSADSYTLHDRALRATRSNLADLDEHLAQLAGCIRVLMKDAQFTVLLRTLGYNTLPRHIHDCLK